MSGIAAVQSRIAGIQAMVAEMAPPAPRAGGSAAGAPAAAATATRSPAVTGPGTATGVVPGAAPPAVPGAAPGPGAVAAPSAFTTTTTTSFSADGFSQLLAGLVDGAARTAATSAPAPTSPATGRPGGATGADLVAAARAHLGVPYRWGGTDPATGLDCSGLVQRAFKELGVDVPRVAKDQGRVGRAVPDLASARPGDLVVLGGGKHIGIYVGDGKILHASKPGDVVKISTVWETPTAIRRVLGEGGSSAGTTGTATAVPVSAPLDAAAARPSGVRGDVSSAVQRFEPLFAAATARHGLPAGLLAAVAQQESGGNPAAVSPAGARGLMQFMPATARGLGVDPMDPASAVDGAGRLLAQHLRRYDGSVPLALAAYNAGPGAVDRYDGVPPYQETQQYVKKITAALGMRA